MIKSNSVMTCEVNGTVLTWTFNDGKTVVFDVSKAVVTVADLAKIHGFRQKIADAAAMSRDAETGKSATVAEKREAMEKVVAALYAGDWNAAREAGESGLLFEALSRHYKGKRSADSIKAFLKSKTPKERAALINSKKLKSQVDAIRTERGKATGIDGDALLESFPE